MQHIRLLGLANSYWTFLEEKGKQLHSHLWMAVVFQRVEMAARIVIDLTRCSENAN